MVVSCLTIVIKCSVLWGFPVCPWLSDVVLCDGFLFYNGYQTEVIRCCVLWWFPVLPLLSYVVLCDGILSDLGYEI